MIPGHNNPLAAMAFNRLGTRLATASEKVRIMRRMTSRNTCSTCAISYVLFDISLNFFKISK